jgi:hypothetical protein
MELVVAEPARDGPRTTGASSKSRMVKMWMRKILVVSAAVLWTVLPSCGSESGTSSKSDTVATASETPPDSYPLNEYGQPDVPKDVVQAWPGKFCSLTIGMSRDEVHQVMGPPTSSFSDSSANQDEWDGYDVSVTAFYDINDKVQQLDDSTGTSALPCESSRR